MSGALEQLLAPAATASLPAWAEALQTRDRERFRDHGLPHKRLEDWKYTPLTRLGEAVGEAGGDEPAERLDLGAVENMVTLRLTDGVPEAFGPSTLPVDGLSVEPLAEAFAGDDGTLRDLIESLDSEAPSLAMSALNTATLGQGLVVRVRAGVDAGTLFLDWRNGGTERLAEGGPVANSRLLLLLEAGARLDLVEAYAAGGVTNVVHQVRLDAGSRFRHARYQDNPAESWLITRTELEQGADSAFEQTSLDLGGGLARHDLRARLAAPGASCTALGAYLPDGDAHVDHHLDVRHEAPGCSSEQTFRGVLHGRGKAVFNGRVHVLPGADDSEAHQSNQNLLLSREAEVNTKPELIIEADEVIASHGATVGQLDETAVFYLRSRGIAEGLARRMLTGAFCRSVVDAMGNDAAREAFRARLEQSLEGAA